MKKYLLLAVLFSIFSTGTHAQYVLKKEIEGLQFFTKWGHEKWYSKKSPKVLLVKIVNTSEVAIEFDFGVEFFMDLLLVEESKPKDYCLSAGKTLLPRVSGLVFKPESADPDSLDSFELSGLDLTRSSSRDCITN